MPESIKQAALSAALRVFETATFMNVMPCDLEAPAPATEPEVSATVAFHGAQAGSLTVQVPHSILGPLAANMLGELEDCDIEEKGQDALKEIANMICGNFLTMWVGDEEIFELSPPEIHVSPDPLAPDNPAARVFFAIEETFGQMIIAVGEDASRVPSPTATENSGS
jgi:CheY-specific phosphatase CheX